jgi:hypothetical protein
MDYLGTAAGGANFPVPDYNPDAAPSSFFQGVVIPDVRFVLAKSKLNGFAGVQPNFLQSAGIETVDAIPSAFGTAKIAALAHTVNGTAMTLVTTQAAGISVNVPIVPFNSSINGVTPVVAPIVLDYGFAFCATVAGSKTLYVSDSTQFSVGMPLVLPCAKTSTTALLTWVTGIVSATQITVNDAPGVSVSGTIPIGSGNNWPGAPLQTPSQAYPTGHYPYLAAGPLLILDPAQSIVRGVSITTGTGGTGGNIVVSGWDIYWQPMNETIAASATASTTVYGKKAFKALKSVTPAFTDATGTYSVGTSDVFGFNLRARNWERTSGAWAAGFLTGSSGFTAYTTAALGDVRGTLQVSSQGGGTGYGTTNSNGALSGGGATTAATMGGNRLVMYQNFSVADTIAATPLSYASAFGATQT